MSFVVTNIGTATISGVSLVFTIGTTIAIGTEVVVCINTGAASISTCSDSQSNTYTLIKAQANNNDPNNQGVGGVYHSKLTTALGASDTITITDGVSTRKDMSVCSVTGAGALDTAVTAAAFGASSTPSVTSGTPAVSGELFIGVISQSNTRGIAQPGSWAAPPNQESSGGSVGGGNLVNAGSAAETYNPTLSGGAADWAAIIFAYKPAAVASAVPKLPLLGVGMISALNWIISRRHILRRKRLRGENI